MNLDGVVAKLMPGPPARLPVVRVTMYDVDAPVPTEPAQRGVTLLDLTGATGSAHELLPLEGPAESVLSGATALAPEGTAWGFGGEAAADDARPHAIAHRQVLTRTGHSLDVYEFGRRAAEADANRRVPLAITDDDIFGD